MDVKTLTVPARATQDAAAPVRPADATTSTATRLDAAQRAHAASVENHQQAVERADRASALHRQAVIQQQRLIAEAAAGRPVDQISITRAKTTNSEAQDSADYARLIAAGARTLLEKSHIDLLRAEAEHLQTKYAAAIQSQITEAQGIDRTFADLQQAIVDHADAAFDTAAAANAMRVQIMAVDAHMATNATLQAMPPSERPTVRLPTAVVMKPIKIAFIENGFGEELAVAAYSVATRLRNVHGLMPLAQETSQPHPAAGQMMRVALHAENRGTGSASICVARNATDLSQGGQTGGRTTPMVSDNSEE